MNISNLQFFDNSGYNLNFEWNPRQNCWEGFIYLPKTSVGLYANTTVYVLEKIDDNFYFPTGEMGDSITFKWDILNKFVDEFFMFEFDDDYVIKDTSALVYTPNDGPDCQTLIVNRFDEYEITLDGELNNKALPIHIAFKADEKYDATTYNRTLIMSYNDVTIARIKFFIETVEEDERLKVWNTNLGYHITPEDNIIFYKSDIKEIKPDYNLINEKRKELMLEGHNIYPYIGSYRAIINAIKFFGYDNLGIIEYWRNVNTSDENFGKIYHTSRYSLTKKETICVGARVIALPNKDYKKVNKIALVYSINTPTGEVDEWELPYVKEEFTYTIEEALIKLYALKVKLNKEFMPGSSRIIDIIGEANYFGIQALTKKYAKWTVDISDDKFKPSFEVNPTAYLHLTDDRYFNKYILDQSEYGDSDTEDMNSQFNVIENISDTAISDIGDNPVSLSVNMPDNKTLCTLYTNYYNDLYNHTRYEDREFKDDEGSPSSAKVVLTNTTFDGYTFDDIDICFGFQPSSMKTICDKKENNDYTNDSDQPGTIVAYDNIQHGSGYNLVTIGNSFYEDPTIYYSTETELTDDNYLTDGSTSIPSEIGKEISTIPVYWYATSTYNYQSKYGCVYVDIVSYEIEDITDECETSSESDYNGHITFGNCDTFGHTSVKWTVTMSENQYDEEYKNLGIVKIYDYKDWTFETPDDGTIEDYAKLFVRLPYVGYYDVTLTIDGTYTKTTKKCLKVEPYNLEMRGFYYDARELPDDLKYDLDEDDDMYEYIITKLREMTAWAVSERTDNDTDNDYSMPTYTADGQFRNKGPYYTNKIKEEWYLTDNITYENTLLIPNVKYARYIRNGVDVKPYTWFILSYDSSKIVGKVNPTWTIINTVTGKKQTYSGKFLTLLLREEGKYTIKLSVTDTNGNEYEISRNILVVSDTANHKMYQTFKKEYDSYIEYKNLAKIRDLQSFTLD